MPKGRRNKSYRHTRENAAHSRSSQDRVLSGSPHESESAASVSVINTDSETQSHCGDDESSRCSEGNSRQEAGSARNSKSLQKSKLNFSFTTYVKESHGKSIFGVQFCEFFHRDHEPTFATVGANQVTFYKCDRSNGEIKLQTAYLDADAEECFFTCAWSVDDPSGQPLLAAAGKRGIIRIISPCTHDPCRNYIGHGQSINELRFSSKDSNLLLSASKDHSLRLWNIKTDVCIAIFGGVEGHRDELLSADIDIEGKLLISCGMDHSFKIWKLDNPGVKNAIQESYKHKKNSSGGQFKTYGQHFPDFTTRDIHSNYVDCVRWFGRLVLSKSCDNKIVMWTPRKTTNPEGNFLKTSDGYVTTILHKYDFSACEIWFMRFSLDYYARLMAVGNQNGKIYVWDLDVESPTECRHAVMTHPKCTMPIRQIALSKDGNVLIAVCDDATIWRWDRNASPPPSSSTASSSTNN